MAEFSITVMGLMIDTQEKDFTLYRKSEASVRNITQDSSKMEGFVSSFQVRSLEHIIGFLSAVKYPNPQFVIVYDASCANKEEHIRKLLVEINKNSRTNLLPVLISIGQDQTPWNEDFTSQFSVIKTIERPKVRDDLLKNLVEQEVDAIKQEIIAADKAQACALAPEIKPAQIQAETPSCMSNLSMLVLGGFIAVAGISVVAIALTLLFGVTGLIVAGVGVTAALAVGLFARHVCKDKGTDADLLLNYPNTI